MSDQLLAIRYEQLDGSLLVQLSGELDLSNAHEVQHELERAVQARPRVVIDLAEVEYLDSQGLRLIKKLNDNIKSNGGELQLIAPPDSFARQAFDMARMSSFIQIRDLLER
jgi:anti-sigma B factor antagonist